MQLVSIMEINILLLYLISQNCRVIIITRSAERKESETGTHHGAPREVIL